MRILLVEDDEILADALYRTLVQSAYAVDLANNGEQADRALATHTYDLVVLDVGLPGISGFEVLRRLRGRKSRVPVLLLTALDALADRVRGLDLGADDYLTKPFAFSLLVARLHALSRRGPGTRPTVLRVGSLALDPARRTVHRGTTEIQLTARELGLLEYLVRNAGGTVTKSQILDNVWDPAFEGGMNVVEIYVGYLRRKIDEPFGLSTLQTVRGVGYRLAADDPSQPLRTPDGPVRARGPRR